MKCININIYNIICVLAHTSHTHTLAHTPHIKCLGIKRMKDMRDVYTKHKSVWQEINKALNKWTDMSGLWIRRLNIVKMSILPN